jgi:hypothetical protein
MVICQSVRLANANEPVRLEGVETASASSRPAGTRPGDPAAPVAPAAGWPLGWSQPAARPAADAAPRPAAEVAMNLRRLSPVI